MNKHIIAGLGILIGLGPVWGIDAASVSATTPPAGNKVPTDQLVAQLGSKSWAKRDAAQQRLIKIGWDSLPALRKAQGSKDLEVAQRASFAAEEIERQMEARRTKLRGEMGEGYFRVSKENYLALLALPDPPLRDCYPATFVFRHQKDWPALVTALEASGATLQRLMNTPVEQFVKATKDVSPARGIRGFGPVPQPPQLCQTPGSYVYVQKSLDGKWQLCQGTVKDWLPMLKKTQQSLKRDCAGVYWELGRLYQDRLKRPKDAAGAFEQAAAQPPIGAEPLNTLAPKVWPTVMVDGAMLMLTGRGMGPSRTMWSARDALNDLAGARLAAGDIEGALEARIRVMIAVRLLRGNYRKEPEKVWGLARQLPADAELPPLPSFCVLTPGHPKISLGKGAAEERSAKANVADVSIVAGPGHRLATLKIVADLESQGEQGQFYCYALVGGKCNILGIVTWRSNKQRGRQNRTMSFRVPVEAEVLHFRLGRNVQVHSATVTATFAPSVSLGGGL